MTATPSNAPFTGYGFCPQCGAPGTARERCIGGHDQCANGHLYFTAHAISEAVAQKIADTLNRATQPPSLSAKAAAEEIITEDRQNLRVHEHAVEVSTAIIARHLPSPVAAEWRLIDAEAMSGKRVILGGRWNDQAAPHCQGKWHEAIAAWPRIFGRRIGLTKDRLARCRLSGANYRTTSSACLDCKPAPSWMRWG